MLFCNTTARIVFLSLILSQASSTHALPVEGEVNDTAHQTAGAVPPAPPGPYFSSAMPSDATIKASTSKPVQMPVSVPVIGNSDEVAENIVKAPVQAPPQKTEQTQRTYNIESTNPLAEWPGSVESTGGPGSKPSEQWTPGPPAPPGPYGFVPNYTPRSAVNSTGRYGYRTPYYPGNNAYGAPYGRPAPGMMYPQMNPGYSNPGYPNPGYYYGRPNQGGYNQGNFNQGRFDQRNKQNNLNQGDMSQGNMNQGQPK